VSFGGQTIPARRLRFGGAHFARDEDFVHSGEEEAKRLTVWCGLGAQSRVLDVGCGPGRLPIGILRTAGDIAAYRGIDVSRTPIEWCSRHIQLAHPSFQFLHINVRNDRYNPSGESLNDRFRLPFPSGSFDIIYLYSVFSHMGTEDVQRYLREYARLLAPDGSVFLTAFVEEAVPSMEENPQGYGNLQWKGALHCVRFESGFFAALVRGAGLQIVRQSHGTETDGQSAFLLHHADNGSPSS
jgi:SAM-dependent methyltransferase